VGYRALLIDLDGLIEELRVEVLDFLHGQVVLFDPRHDLFARDVTTVLTGQQKFLKIGDDCHSFSLHAICKRLRPAAWATPQTNPRK
jgi:hypothetical protein